MDGTVLTVWLRRVPKLFESRTRLVQERFAYVVSGDANEIAKSLNQQSRTGRGLVFGMRFNVTDIPGPVRAINVEHIDAEIAADSITREERDYFFTSGFNQHEIFDRIVERSKAKRKQYNIDRADRIRADLDELGTSQYPGSAAGSEGRERA
ncbi:hypothetical protein [Leucobacter aridicollis]|uniref:hypothetical protein n=1 Tax=Leucobacter aridicollis TaxID=283878 RepID=UPI0037CBDB06